MQEVYAGVWFITYMRGDQALEPTHNTYQYLQGTRTDQRQDIRERQTLSQFKAKQSQRVSTTHDETIVLTIQQTSCMQLGGDHVPSWVCTTPSYLVGKTQLETEKI